MLHVHDITLYRLECCRVNCTQEIRDDSSMLACWIADVIVKHAVARQSFLLDCCVLEKKGWWLASAFRANQVSLQPFVRTSEPEILVSEVI